MDRQTGIVTEPLFDVLAGRPPSPGQVADHIQILVAATALLAGELDALAACAPTVTDRTVSRLRRLADQLAPGAAARAELAAVDPQVLLDGLARWQKRRRPARVTAEQRAHDHWVGLVRV